MQQSPGRPICTDCGDRTQPQSSRQKTRGTRGSSSGHYRWSNFTHKALPGSGCNYYFGPDHSHFLKGKENRAWLLEPANLSPARGSHIHNCRGTPVSCSPTQHREDTKATDKTQCTLPGPVLNGDLHHALTDQRPRVQCQNQQHPCPQPMYLHTHSPQPQHSCSQCSGDLKSWASNLEQSAEQLEEFNLDTGLKPALSAQDTPFRPKGEGSPVCVQPLARSWQD